MSARAKRAAGWRVDAELADLEVHVRPVGDAITHDFHPDCLCGPMPEPHINSVDDVVWIYTHHSLDGREKRERAR